MFTLKDYRLKRPVTKAKSTTRWRVCRARLLCSGLVFLLVGGCSSYGVIHNEPGVDVSAGQPYSPDNLGTV